MPEAAGDGNAAARTQRKGKAAAAVSLLLGFLALAGFALFADFFEWRFETGVAGQLLAFPAGASVDAPDARDAPGGVPDAPAEVEEEGDTVVASSRGLAWEPRGGHASAAASALPRLAAQTRTGAPRSGEEVAVQQDFLSDSPGTKVSLRPGLRGTVLEFDAKGFALISFEGLEEWVSPSHFPLLRSTAASVATPAVATPGMAKATKPRRPRSSGHPAPAPAPALAPAAAPEWARSSGTVAGGGEVASAATGGAELTLGFYLPVFSQIPSVLRVVRDVRKLYPNSPIHLLNDGGSVDFGGVCKLPQYNCSFEWVPAENSRWNPHSWLVRMRRVAIKLGTEYVIYLEPDVQVRHRHTHPMLHDAGGIWDNFNNAMHDQTRVYLEWHGRERNPCFQLKWPHFGLAGGSYFRTEAIIDAFAPEHIRRVDWGSMARKEGERTYSSDFAMIIALSMRGWHVYPWKDAAQNFASRGLPDDPEARKAFAKQWPAYDESAAFQHDHKEHYGDPVPEEELSYIKRISPGRDTSCNACVWYEGNALERVLPIPSAPPEMAQDADRYVVERQTTHPPKCSEAEMAALVTGAPTAASADGDSKRGSDGRNPAIGSAVAASSAPAAMIHPAAAQPIAAKFPSGAAGLPVDPGPRPDWLIKDDILVVDARPKRGGGILVAQEVLIDQRGEWGRSKTRPAWLRAILATNREHVRKWGHAMVLRWKPSTPQLTPWMVKNCGSKSDEQCERENERENFNWEKHLQMLEYLKSPENFDYVLLLDADAAFVRLDHNTLQMMVGTLENKGKKVFMADEDWLLHGKGRINGGLVLAKNCPWTLDLFRDTFESHLRGPAGYRNWRIGVPDQQCSSNEQICLNDLWSGQPKEHFRPHAMVESGQKWNRGECVLRQCGDGGGAANTRMKKLGLSDPDLEIMHFMGGSKQAAYQHLCNGNTDYTGGGRKGYGCGS